MALAGRTLSPVWPLETFIAVNPLGGLEHLPFTEAIAEAGDLLGARGTLDESAFRAAYADGRITDADLLGALTRFDPGSIVGRHPDAGGRLLDPAAVLLADLLHGDPSPPPVRVRRTLSEQHAPEVAAIVDAQTAKWCAAYVDEGQAAWSMPDRDQGFYTAWRMLAPRDRSLPARVRHRLRLLPHRAEDAALRALADLEIGESSRRHYLEAHLSAVPGWAAHILWRSEHRRGVDLVDLLAMRLAYEAALFAEHPLPAASEGEDSPATPTPTVEERAAKALAALGLEPSVGLAAATRILERLPVAARPSVWLDAYEGHYRDLLLERLAERAPTLRADRAAAQVVFCIDVRSEGIRRHLETAGPYETLGFAGFFAVAIRFRTLAGTRSTAQCPVLLQPRNEIVERSAAGTEHLAARRLAGEQALASTDEAFAAAKNDLVGPFALAEALGWCAGLLALAKTTLAGPYGAIRERLRNAASPPAPTTLTVEDGFSPEERALFAEAALTMMGLTREFARLVVLCGHGSSTENNPYASALDCGACGGHRGGPNARAAATILNRPDVRSEIAARGIAVPNETWFVAAEHDTAADRVTILDEWLVPETHRDELRRLSADLTTAAAALSAERCATLPGAPRSPSPERARRHVRARSTDWAQVFPEWGLAGNAAFIVGPREITRGIDLERRTFLHSYEASVDPDGTALETILTAPLVVAQWINCQYYFSTVDPGVFGSGTKTIHNVVGDIGVLAGHNGDLQLGLPWQSVAEGERLVHEPMRLLAVVQAPLDRIDAIVDRNTVLRHLFGNQWVGLAARESPEAPWQRYTSHGWTPWNSRR